MKTPSRSVFGTRARAFACAVFSTAGTLAAQDIDLTQHAPIRQSSLATYAYYARGDASGAPIPPYTVKFYPGDPHGGNTTADRDGARADTGSNAVAIPLASGDLTDNDPGTSVSGWINIEDAHGAGASSNHPGTFDILFDLGAVYAVGSVEIVYSDSSGRRWVTSGNLADQQVSTAVSLKGATPVEADFTRFKFSRFTANTSSATAAFSSGAPRPARYVNLRLTATLDAGVGGSIGGHLHEVRIHGDPRPLRVATRADDFVETIGVNTHFKEIGQSTPWTSPAGAALALVKNSGVRYIRDDIPINNTTAAFGWLNELYVEKGIRTTWVPLTWLRPTPAPSAIASTLAANPAFDAVEGANEPENAAIFDPPSGPQTPYVHGALTDDPPQHNYPASRAWQTDVHAAVAGHSSLGHVRVIAPAMASPHNIRRLLPMTAMHAAAMHSYPLGRPPGAGFRYQFDSSALPAVGLMAGSAPAKPVVVTETGYHTALQTPAQRNQKPVSELAQYKYLPRLYAEHFLRGVSQTFSYELIDGGVDQTDQEKNFGWTNSSHQPKPVYHAIRRLIGHLGEASWDAGTLAGSGGDYAPDALSYTLHAPIDHSVNSSGVTTTPRIRHLLLQKKTAGEWVMLLWNEVPSYSYVSPTDQADISNPAVPVKLAFNTPVPTATIYKLNSDTPVATVTANAATLGLDVPDEILVVKIRPAPLPAPWTQGAVGAGAAAGSAGAEGDKFTVQGAGIGTSGDGKNDSLHFVRRKVGGDVTLIARVAGTAAKAGISVRAGTAGGDMQVSLAVQSDGNVHFQRRASAGASTSTQTAAGASPRWLKLERSGNDFSAYQSGDGLTWSQVGSTQNLGMPVDALAGLVVCSGSATTLASATFTDLSLVGALPLVTLRATDAEARAYAPTDPAAFRVHRAGPAGSALVVNYAVDGTAVSGTHYTVLSGSVTIPAGQSFADIAVNPAALAGAQGRRHVVLTLAASANYALGAHISDSATLVLGPGLGSGFDTHATGWSTQTRSTLLRVGSAEAKLGAGALRWTYHDDGVTRHSNELQLNYLSGQNWSAATKLVLWFRSSGANPLSDAGQEIVYDYRNGSMSVSNSTGVGSFTLDHATDNSSAYRRIELDLGRFPRDNVTRLFFYVDGNAFATGDHVWYIDEVGLE